MGAPRRRPPRPRHGRARRCVLRAVRRFTRCTCWAGWSRSRCCCGRRASADARPRRLRLATLYMDFVAAVWLIILRRGVRGMRSARPRRVRRWSCCARHDAGVPPPGRRAPDLHGRRHARRPQRRARRARARARRLHPLLPPLSRRRGRRQGTRRRRPAPAAARSPPRRLQVRGGRRPASSRATTTSSAPCASGLHGTAMLPWDVPAAELDDLIQYMKVFAPRWRTEQPGEAIVPTPIRGRDASPTRSSAAAASITASRSARSPATPPTRPSRRSTWSPRS